MTNKLYDKLKFVAQIGLPAFGTLYYTVATLWGWPSTEEVVATIVAVDTFLGVTLQISTKKYDSSEAKFAGSVDIMYLPEGQKTYAFNLNEKMKDDPTEIEQSESITFKVNPPTF